MVLPHVALHGMAWLGCSSQDLLVKQTIFLMVATSGLEVLPYLINNKTYILTHRYFGLPQW